MTQYQNHPPAPPAGFLPLNVAEAKTYRGTTGSQPVFAPGVYVATVTNIEQGPMFRDSGAVGLHVALAIAERPDGGGRRRRAPPRRAWARLRRGTTRTGRRCTRGTLARTWGSDGRRARA